MQPIPVFADDNTPPPPDPIQIADSGGTSSIGQPTSSETDSTTQPADTKPTYAASQLSAIDTAVAPTDSNAPPLAAASTEASVPSPQTLTESEVPDTPTTVPSILSQAPTGTSLTVIDQNGNMVPMATQQASNIIANGDPSWCPTGKLPGDPSCTASFGTFNGPSGLLAELQANPGTYNGNGTIYIAYNYFPSGADVVGVLIPTSNLQGGGSNGNLGDLTLQSGWDFMGNTLSSIQDYTDFGENPLEIDWVGNVTVNDIAFNGTSTHGLEINVGTGNIHLHHISASNMPSGGGVGVRTYNGSVTVDGNNVFNNNFSTGLYIVSNGDITISNVTADNNGFVGVLMDNTSGIGNIQVTGVNQFNGNGLAPYQLNYIDAEYGSGLDAFSNGNVSLSGMTADNNYYDGALLCNWNLFTHSCNKIGGDIAITGMNEFNGNGYTGIHQGLGTDQGSGLVAYSDGLITLSGVTADNNYYAGSSTSANNIIASCSDLSSNNSFGMVASLPGTLTLNNVAL
jgi:hypothetical protein